MDRYVRVKQVQCSIEFEILAAWFPYVLWKPFVCAENVLFVIYAFDQFCNFHNM